jgi:hypothetical protein
MHLSYIAFDTRMKPRNMTLPHKTHYRAERQSIPQYVMFKKTPCYINYNYTTNRKPNNNFENVNECIFILQ